ncbi:MAG: DUF1549 and DUF1553 domain-containing protein [Planctomycetes bacterium]|nr:DUF1549 and DUF1553 domain-containing protein [Planctomycetota bacterium]
MNETRHTSGDLWELLEALCEQRIAPAEMQCLEKLLADDPAARRLYREYIALHGTLYWDTALGGEVLPEVARTAQARESAPFSRDSKRSALAARLSIAAAALLLIAGLVTIFIRPWADDERVAQRPDRNPRVDAPLNDSQSAGRPDASGGGLTAIAPRPDGASDDTARSDGPAASTTQQIARATNSDDAPVVAPRPIPIEPHSAGSTIASVTAVIDEHLAAGWEYAGLSPSPPADDAEWLRRVSLDLVGHIPSADEAVAFLADRDPHKREKLVERLLEDPAYVRHWTTLMTNLLVGRTISEDVDRPALEKFFRESFAANRPWDTIVADLVAAEGAVDENGAANFLVAHLNNEATPATAVTARVFLGVQAHCMQCHDHPLHSDWKQEQFWQLNAFFKETRIERRRQDGRIEAVLVSRGESGATYFETPQGVMKATYPKFEHISLGPDSDANRRDVLAEAMFTGDAPQAAGAMVNRMWAHFFGYGFTRPVDDMGPHNPPSHPELLESLTREFVASGYDLKQLVRWIAGSRAYQLSSRFGEGNILDDPPRGEPAMFSRVYVKPMTPEQLFDSVLVATRADLAAGSNWNDVSRRRQEWLQQFVHAFETDENDEATHFEGTIPQALAMMNGELVQAAVATHQGTVLSDVLADEAAAETEKVRRLCLAALSRYPTSRETEAVRRLLRQYAAAAAQSGRNRREATAACLQDVFWAYLNSSEFRLVH